MCSGFNVANIDWLPGEEFGVVGLVIQVDVPARLQLAPQLAKERRAAQGVREHVIADDQIERAVERDREVLEVDQR